MREHEAEDAEALLALGRKFRAQQCGRRPGVLSVHVRETVKRICPVSFEELLAELEYEAVRNRTLGGGPILRVNREWECVLYLDGKSEREVSFKRIRNIAQIRKARIPLSRESDT